MGRNIYSQLPVDGTNEPLQNFASPKTAVSVTSGFGGISSVITLTDNTTTIEVAAISGTGGSGILLKWIAAGDTQASVTAGNFDNSIPPNYYRQFAVPIEKAGVSGASVVGANVMNGLYKRVAFISHGTPPASIFTAQYS